MNLYNLPDGVSLSSTPYVSMFGHKKVDLIIEFTKNINIESKLIELGSTNDNFVVNDMMICFRLSSYHLVYECKSLSLPLKKEIIKQSRLNDKINDIIDKGMKIDYIVISCDNLN